MPFPQDEIGILVGQQDYRESDRIVQVLTPTLGLVTAMARSARASRRRFGGALDFGNKLNITIKQGRGDLWHLEEVSVIEGRIGARSDVTKVSMMAYACEVSAALAQRHQPEARLFGLLDVVCLLMEHSPTIPSPLFRNAFEAKALTFVGMTPGLIRCVACEGPLQSPTVFVPASGGGMHQECDREEVGIPINQNWLQSMERARRTPLKDLINAAHPPGPQWLLSETIEAHIEQELRSKRVLRAFC